MENSSENIENLYRKENKLDEKLRLSSFIIFSIFQIAFASKFLLGESDTSLLLFIFGISILMILLVKIPSLRSLYISKEKINAEFDNLKDQVKKADTKIDEAKDKIEKLFLLTMSNPMYHNLEKLANPPFGEYFMESALKRELYHLRNIGYIEVSSQSEGSISKIPESGKDLSVYVNVTDTGKEFIKNRESF